MKIPKILAIFIGLGFALVALEPVHAAVFNCPAGDVDCLINSLNVANVNGEEDTINLEESTYTLTKVDNNIVGPNGLPSITSQIIVNGNGATIKRDSSAPQFRIIHVSATGALSINGIRISGGKVEAEGGGGIWNDGILKLTVCIISENESPGAGWDGAGGGIWNTYNGNLTLEDCSVSDNETSEQATAIYNFGIAKLTNCTISNNWSDNSDGGGIDNPGTVTLTNCTFSNNRAGRYGGAIQSNGTATMTNCTFSNNKAVSDGGAIQNAGTATMTNCTISGNESLGQGGGIDNTGTAQAVNTIVANNTADENCSGNSINSLGHNLEDDNTCGFTAVGDIINTDPGLGLFIDLGSPGGGHFPLLATSQAIDSGDNAACPPTDQLGNPRVDGDGDGVVTCDIGAVEFQGIVLINEFVTFDPDPLTYLFDPDTTGCPSGAVGKFSFDATLTNISEKELSNLNVEVDELTNDNLLLTDEGLKGEGDIFKIATGFENVALNADVELKGAPFFEGGWGGGQIVSKDTIVDGIFLPRGQQWDQGPVWWDSTDGEDRYIEINLKDEYKINSFIVQADDNDAYKLYYWDMTNNNWQLTWDVPNFDAIQGGGMVTRPNPDDNNERHFLPNPITTDALLFRGNMDDSDKLFSVSEIQAFTGAANDYDDGMLSPEEYVDVPFTVCLQEKSPFRFFVNVLGVAENIDLEKGLVAFYPFNGNADEESGNANHGTVHGATLTADRFGNVNSAYDFDGVNDYIEIQDDDTLDVTSGLTISVWIKSDDTSGARAIVAKHNNTTVDFSFIFKDAADIDDKMRLELSENNTWHDLVDLFGNTSIPTKEWIHTAATFDSNTAKIFMNGNIDASKEAIGTIRVSATEMLIGAVNNYSGGVSEYFDGLIDDIRIYERALSAAEIKALYNLDN